MAGVSVQLTPLAEGELVQLHPLDQQMFRRVFDLLESDKKYKNNHKYDLCYQDELTGKPVWALRTGRVFIAFVEADDATIVVTHLSLISRFRPPARPWW